MYVWTTYYICREDIFNILRVIVQQLVFKCNLKVFLFDEEGISQGLHITNACNYEYYVIPLSANRVTISVTFDL
jgi:hypothetical protein